MSVIESVNLSENLTKETVFAGAAPPEGLIGVGMGKSPVKISLGYCLAAQGKYVTTIQHFISKNNLIGNFTVILNIVFTYSTDLTTLSPLFRGLSPRKAEGVSKNFQPTTLADYTD